MNELEKNNKKKIFIFSEIIPYPLTNGGAIAQFFFLESLSHQFEITYCTIIKTVEQKRAIADLKIAIPDLKIDCFEESIQASWQTKLEKLLRTIYFFFEKITISIIKKQDYNNLDPTYKLNNVKFYSQELINFLKNRFSKTKFEFIQLEFFESISLLSTLPSDTTKVFIHHEIRFKRLALSNSKSDNYKQYFQKTLKQIELGLLNISDKVVVFNDEDAKELKQIKSEIFVSPFGIPERMIVKHSVSTQFDKFIFTGTSGHFPNKEGVIWFLDNIYIPLYSLINHPIFIIGNWSKEVVDKYKKYKKIIFTGYQEDITAYFENSIFLSPILSGSGIRTKLLEAFANHIPVMSTKFGSEGLYDQSKKNNHILHFDTKEEFMELYYTILKNSILLTEVANNGFKYFTEEFNQAKLVEKRTNVYL